MKTQCSIAGSALGSLTESPLKALQGNQTGVIQFYALSARGSSVTPAFNKFSCVQKTTPLNDALNLFNYVIGHTWTRNDDFGHTYKQTDALDPGTLEATSAAAVTDTYPGGFNGGFPPIWNDQRGYFYPNDTTPPDSHFSSTAGADWDKTATRTSIAAALDAVNWSALWADGSSAPNNFVFDRAAISPNQSGTLPFGPSGNTGALVPGNVALGPSLAQTGVVGVLFPLSTSDSLGVSLERVQFQVRNFNGSPIPYFIYEAADVITGVKVLGNPGSTVDAPGTSIDVTGDNIYYRKVSDGFWTHDLQIIQLPDPAMDGPQIIIAPHGPAVRNGSAMGMVVGLTFEEFMLGNIGDATWPDYVFT